MVGLLFSSIVSYIGFSAINRENAPPLDSKVEYNKVIEAQFG